MLNSRSQFHLNFVVLGFKIGQLSCEYRYQKGPKTFCSIFFYFQVGERGSGLRRRGQVQDFYKLREAHLAAGTLFEDPTFPASDSSIFYSRRPPRPFEWKRPTVSRRPTEWRLRNCLFIKVTTSALRSMADCCC